MPRNLTYSKTLGNRSFQNKICKCKRDKNKVNIYRKFTSNIMTQ